MDNSVPDDCDQIVCAGGKLSTVLDATESCGANTVCTAVDTCVGELGAACDSGTPSFCQTSLCVDGACCDSACTGTCKSCVSGTCSTVTNALDDTCNTGHYCDASGTCTVCGSSGMVCCAGGCNDATLSCSSSGTCLKADGQSCSATAECAAGSCVPTWADTDYDSYGDASSPTGNRCHDSALGHYVNGGYADRTGDCCPTDGTVNPGVTGYYQTTIDSCGSFDWNCNGQKDFLYPNGAFAFCNGYRTYMTSFTDCGAYGAVEQDLCDASCNCSYSYSWPSVQQECY
jgi:hypothetical protein